MRSPIQARLLSAGTSKVEDLFTKMVATALAAWTAGSSVLGKKALAGQARAFVTDTSSVLELARSPAAGAQGVAMPTDADDVEVQETPGVGCRARAAGFALVRFALNLATTNRVDRVA